MSKIMSPSQKKKEESEIENDSENDSAFKLKNSPSILKPTTKIKRNMP